MGEVHEEKFLLDTSLQQTLFSGTDEMTAKIS